MSYYNGIYYEVSGEGNAVVLLHGYLESHKIWNNFVSILSGKYKVITIDLPGHGESAVIGETATMEQMAEKVNTVLEQLNIQQTVIIGHSMGGYVSLAFTELFTDKVKGLGLFHSNTSKDSEEAKLNRQRTIELIKNDKLSFISSFIPLLFSPDNVSQYENEIDNLKSIAESSSKEGIIAAQRGMMQRPDRTELLYKLSVPIMFILGMEDPRINYKDILEKAINIKNSHIRLLEKTGHMGFIEAQKQTLDFVSQFVDNCYKV